MNELTNRFMASTTDRKTTIQKQIAELQEKLKLIDQEAVHALKLKLGDARKVVRDLEADLAKLTGEEPTAAPKKARRPRRPSITDEALKDQLIKMMATFGKEGLNAKQIADKMNLDAIRIRKFIGDNKNVLKRQGNAAATKFFLT